MKKVLLIPFILFLFLGCSKEKPRVGNYYGVFTYTNPEGLVKGAEMEITESTKNKVIINGYQLTKDGKKIEGTLNHSSSSFGVTINGEWSHRIFSKDYKINGTFTENYYQGGGQYQSSGTFEIKSK